MIKGQTFSPDALLAQGWGAAIAEHRGHGGPTRSLQFQGMASPGVAEFLCWCAERITVDVPE